MPQQMPIWNKLDKIMASRIPTYFYDFFIDTGQCFHCRQSLRHELHAYNHFMRYHTVKMIPRYYVWDKYHRIWVQTSPIMYSIFKSHGVPVGMARY